MSRGDQILDYARAKQFGNDLDTKLLDFNSILERTLRTIEECKSWWKGGTEDQYIAKARETVEEIKTLMEKVKKDYVKAMDDTVKHYKKEDLNLGQFIRR